MAISNIFGRIETIQRELAELQEALSPLMEAFGGRPSAPAHGAMRATRRRTAKAGGKRAPAPRRKLSPAVARLRKLQGKYMGVVRHLTAAQKVRVKKIRETNGLAAAIAAARRATKKR